AERLQPRAEPRRRAAHSAGDRPDLAVLAGQQRDDPAGLPQLVHAQHHAGVTVEVGHPAIIPPRADNGAGRRAAGDPSETEPAQLLRVALPVLGHFHVQVEVDLAAQQAFDLLARVRTDVPQALTAAPENDPLLARPLDVEL